MSSGDKPGTSFQKTPHAYEERSQWGGERGGQWKGHGGERKGNGLGFSPEQEHTLEAFTSLLQAVILREVSGECFSRIFISSQGVPFGGHSLFGLVDVRAADFSHCSRSWSCLPGFLLFWVWN